MEATLLSLTPAQVADISGKRPKIGSIWTEFKADVEKPIAVILLLNTAAHTVGASIAGAQFGKVFGEEYLWVFAAVFTFVMLQFTEILAKTMGVRYNRGLALIISARLPDWRRCPGRSVLIRLESSRRRRDCLKPRWQTS
jgi:Mg2+/Co2+ transporter CorB